jgi:hypothetical protein
MQLINESYKLKGPSSSSLGVPKVCDANYEQKAGVGRTQLDNILQYREPRDGENNMGERTSPNLKAQNKNINKTRFMRISENQSEEAS